MRGLKDRVAIVTGAAGGIGTAICRRFLDEEVRIVALDVNADALKQLAGELGADDGRLLGIAADISDYRTVKEAVDRGVAKFGKLDILVNNAGWDVAKPFLQTEPDLWDKIIAVNLRGPLNLHKAALPHLIAAGGGKVVNIASDAGRVGSSGEAVYSACKGGIIAFSKTAAMELAKYNITVNSLAPGFTLTDMLAKVPEPVQAQILTRIPMGRFGKPEEIAKAVLFLAADADYITGQQINVNGGVYM